MLATMKLAVSQQSQEPKTNEELRELIDQVKAQTDLREFLKPKLDHYREFDGYWQANCLAPDHPDTAASLLIYPDGCRCRACTFHADVLDFYRMEHPDEKLADAIAKLLADPSIKFTGEVTTKVLRGLDQDLATRYHLALVDHPEAVAGLEGFGFSRAAIRHFQLGYAETLARLETKERHLAETAPRIEWLELNGEKVPFQRQMRYSVPVFDAGGYLKQIIYRKAGADDLGPKTTLEKGAGAAWLYNEAVLPGAQYAVLASGWGDVVALWMWGIPAVSSISGDGTLKDDWFDGLAHVRQLFVVPDCDLAGEKLVERVQKKMSWARVIALPYEMGSKKDVRDYLKEGHTANDFRRLMKQASVQANWAALKRR